ncbi:hypothetical protein BH09ACT6_BH09ACT6_03670 [soil metagenome]
MTLAHPNAVGPPLRRAPRQSRSEERTNRILSAAAKLISENPPDSVTTTQIATAAGTSVASIYRYFADVDAIFVSLLHQAEADLLVEIRKGFSLAGDDWRDAISRALDIQVDFLENKDTGFHALWFGSTGALAAQAARSNTATDDELTMMLVDELSESRRERLGANPETTVRLVVGILTKGTELAYSEAQSQADPVVIAETKRAAIAYLETYLD